jgi:hypothetical protein
MSAETAKGKLATLTGKDDAVARNGSTCND